MYQRRYPNGPLYSGATGFYSVVFGRSELEQAMNDYLNGDAPELAAQTFADLVLGRPKQGAAVVTTIDAELQAVAARALGSQAGAVVALDPADGVRAGHGLESDLRPERRCPAAPASRSAPPGTS